MKKVFILLLLTFGMAQAVQGQINNESRTAFMKHFVTLDAVIENRTVIKLTEGQKRTIQKAVKAMQAEVSDLSWEHETAAQKLETLSSTHPVDASSVRAQAETLMDIETRLKLENLKLHITIKNTLSQKQYEKLQGLTNG